MIEREHTVHDVAQLTSDISSLLAIDTIIAR